MASMDAPHPDATGRHRTDRNTALELRRPDRAARPGSPRCIQVGPPMRMSASGAPAGGRPGEHAEVLQRRTAGPGGTLVGSLSARLSRNPVGLEVTVRIDFAGLRDVGNARFSPPWSWRRGRYEEGSWAKGRAGSRPSRPRHDMPRIHGLYPTSTLAARSLGGRGVPHGTFSGGRIKLSFQHAASRPLIAPQPV